MDDSTELFQELHRLEHKLNSPAANTAGRLGAQIRMGLRKELQDIEVLRAEWDVSHRVMYRGLNILVRLRLVEITEDGDYRVAPRWRETR